MIDFATWFSAGCYGGLGCCLLAIVISALHTTLRKRGTTRQLAGTIVACAVSSLLLFLALVWYSLRFDDQQASAPSTEVSAMLAYVALCGWLLPLGSTAIYCLYARPRVSTTAVRIPLQSMLGRTKLEPPRSQAGVTPPFVIRADIPWGWLEYRSGNFSGQKLALKRAVVTLGRDEENDIWLDDELASRHHAELACDQAYHIYLTDCRSMNGTLLNGEQVRGTALVQSNDEIEIGSYRFRFTLAERHSEPADEDDPLARRGNTQQSPAFSPLPEPALTPEQVPQLPFSSPGFLRLPGKPKE